MIQTIKLTTAHQKLFEITPKVTNVVNQANISEGLCTLFLKHTSASLLIQENADPSVQTDLQNWLNRLVPEGDELYTHRLEGLDDMPAHLKTALTAVNLSIPIVNGKLALGTWQGIFLWEHRHDIDQRSIIIHILQG
ncbi:secondary thiamine-phosphate synthase enzyme YjbQ [Candidatus Marithrix sp. Canyon 246]|uniref:secondary thiamine-phosphate synthase enzyme YjbQ n=1 Tax=Candidatus Marithrix sp. Canyon 246 TaxID=1827136 RepID=UPI000849EF7D|nr:secondary thiamine-phosphate synthase enzyme YjbQ [Candidatus Marithrix sp. Canyon 246]